MQIFSSYAGGGYQNQSGTSMASPHVAGVAALVRGANASLSPAQVADVLRRSGTFPDGSLADGGCPSSSSWPNDPDGVTEPMVNALRAVQFATGGGGVGLPNVILTSPVDGAQIDGLAALTATASDPQGITSVDFLVDGVQVGSDSSSPYAVTWDTDQVVDGPHTITARATDGGSAQSCVGHSVTTGHPEIQGDWVGAYGSAGYVLGAWNGTSDLAVLPGASLTLLQGDRFLYGPNGEARSVENATETERRQAVVWDDVQVRLRLDFPSGFSGPLDVYAVDYDTTGRRQTVTVDDGSGPVSRAITTSFSQGAWIHYTVNVAPGGSVSIVAARTAGANAVISGVFLGPAGPPASGGPSPTPTPTPTVLIELADSHPDSEPDRATTARRTAWQARGLGRLLRIRRLRACWMERLDGSCCTPVGVVVVAARQPVPVRLEHRGPGRREPVRVRATTHCFLGRRPDPPETRLPKRLQWTAGHLRG